MNEEKKVTAEENLLSSVFKRFATDTAFKAALKKADNPDTEYQSWEYLADYGINLEYENARLPYTTVLSAAARSSRNADGSVPLGRALLLSYKSDSENTAARSKLRRIIACDSIDDVCSVLRPVLRFIGSKDIAVSYATLLRDLKYFSKDSERTKARWAEQFFEKTESKEEDNG